MSQSFFEKFINIIIKGDIDNKLNFLEIKYLNFIYAVLIKDQRLDKGELYDYINTIEDRNIKIYMILLIKILSNDKHILNYLPYQKINKENNNINLSNRNLNSLINKISILDNENNEIIEEIKNILKFYQNQIKILDRKQLNLIKILFLNSSNFSENLQSFITNKDSKNKENNINKLNFNYGLLTPINICIKNGSLNEFIGSIKDIYNEEEIKQIINYIPTDRTLNMNVSSLGFALFMKEDINTIQLLIDNGADFRNVWIDSESKSDAVVFLLYNYFFIIERNTNIKFIEKDRTYIKNMIKYFLNKYDKEENIKLLGRKRNTSLTIDALFSSKFTSRMVINKLKELYDSPNIINKNLEMFNRNLESRKKQLKRDHGVYGRSMLSKFGIGRNKKNKSILLNNNQIPLLENQNGAGFGLSFSTKKEIRAKSLVLVGNSTIYGLIALFIFVGGPHVSVPTISVLIIIIFATIIVSSIYGNNYFKNNIIKYFKSINIDIKNKDLSEELSLYLFNYQQNTIFKSTRKIANIGENKTTSLFSNLLMDYQHYSKFIQLKRFKKLNNKIFNNKNINQKNELLLFGKINKNEYNSMDIIKLFGKDDFRVYLDDKSLEHKYPHNIIISNINKNNQKRTFDNYISKFLLMKNKTDTDFFKYNLTTNRILITEEFKIFCTRLYNDMSNYLKINKINKVNNNSSSYIFGFIDYLINLIKNNKNILDEYKYYIADFNENKKIDDKSDDLDVMLKYRDFYYDKKTKIKNTGLIIRLETILLKLINDKLNLIEFILNYNQPDIDLKNLKIFYNNEIKNASIEFKKPKNNVCKSIINSKELYIVPNSTNITFNGMFKNYVIYNNIDDALYNNYYLIKLKYFGNITSNLHNNSNNNNSSSEENTYSILPTGQNNEIN